MVFLIILIIAISLFSFFLALKKVLNRAKIKISQQQKEYESRIINLHRFLYNLHKFTLESQSYSSKEDFILNLPKKISNMLNPKYLIFKTEDTITGKENILMMPKMTNFPTNELLKNISHMLEGESLEIIENPEDKFGLTGLQTNILIASKLFLKDTFHLTTIMAVEDGNTMDIIPLFLLLMSNILSTYKNLAYGEELHKSYIDTIALLSHLIEVKDIYTSSHVQKTTYYAREICQRLNLPEQITRYIEQAALLHDIGKIAIDSSILLKSSPLTPSERKEIEKHPLLGANILEPIFQLKPISSIIMYHHEWYNGAGYPEGLKGDEIPIGARIVSVLDAFDAMISDRPYRKALTLDKAIEELEKGKGTQFDPKIVEIFVEILNQNKKENSKK